LIEGEATMTDVEYINTSTDIDGPLLDSTY